MKIPVRNWKFWLVLALDIVLVMCAYVGAHLLRFEGSIPPPFLSALKTTLPLVVLVKIFFFYGFNLYRGMWRYTSLIDFMNVVKAVAASSVTLILLILFLYGFVGFSRSVFIMDFVLTLCLVAGVRIAIRLYLLRDTSFLVSFLRKQGRPRKRMLLIGAGAAGEQILRELIGNPHLRAEAVGLLDDNAGKVGKSIHGVPVLGTVDRIEEIDVDFDEILIACPSATGAQMKRIVAACERTGKPFKTMPPLGEVIDGRVSMKMVREVGMEDLIGREEVRLEEDEIKKYLLGKRVLVTGAGGSIGSELVRQIVRFRPGALALADVGEYNLYQVEMECRDRFRGAEVAAYLVDLGDLRPTQRMFAEFRPDVVFHAAAYKHVPLQELNPWETVYNNLLAMRNLIACATETGVDKFVLVSTDKAVRPTNVMGATKRVCEMMAAAACKINRDSALFSGGSESGTQGGTRFISVRFGNVLGSSGSVIPLFQQQIARGGPVTVTHPEITRYFMSIPEAAQLILQAGAMGEGREIFILKMGEPVRIADLAREVIKFHGLEPDIDIEIVFTGLRPGEKLYEELITEGEGIVPTRHEKIMVLHANECGNGDLLPAQLDELLRVADTFDIPAIKAKLREIVPEYTPQ
jgi:FlaA1/EpsC-like NDP-sugar epimerase